jgi:hypothetical protein
MAKETKATKTKTGTKRVRSTILTGSVISVPNVKAEIPARADSYRAKRWKILVGMSGKTIGDYYKAARDAGIPCSKNNPILAAEKGLVVIKTPEGVDYLKTDEYKAYSAPKEKAA